MLKYFIFIVVFCGLLVTSFVTKNVAETPVVEKPYDMQVVLTVKENYTRYDVYNLALYYADSYGIPYQHMLLTIDGESDFQQYAKGDGGKSLGACQIHSSNKIPTEKRNDPRFCLEWTAQKISSGQARMWTAYRTCVLGEVVIDKNGKRILCHATGTL